MSIRCDIWKGQCWALSYSKTAVTAFQGSSVLVNKERTALGFQTPMVHSSLNESICFGSFHSGSRKHQSPDFLVWHLKLLSMPSQHLDPTDFVMEFTQERAQGACLIWFPYTDCTFLENELCRRQHCVAISKGWICQDGIATTVLGVLMFCQG